jgi:hypothetical protein
MSGLNARTPEADALLAASYVRKSDEDNEGLQSQHLVNEQRAAADGYAIPRAVDFRFEDDDTTGVSKRRKGFDRLLQMITSGEAKFNRVYIKDRTRLGRWSDPRFGFYLEVLCEEHGVKLVYSENARHVDYAGEFSPDMIGLFLKEAVDGVVASQERDRLITRVTGGMRYWAMRGFYPGSSAPYGLERWLADESTGARLERIPDGQAVRKSGCRYKLAWQDGVAREVIREVYRLVESGRSLASVARELNERGTPTPSGRGAWKGESVRRIVRNPIYCGDLVWGRTTRDGEPVDQADAQLNGSQAIRVEGFLEKAPISRERWQDVQAILEGNRERWSQRRASAPAYLLSGMVACSACGAGYHGHTSTKDYDNRRRYYRHADAPDGVECDGVNRYVRAEAIEGQVLDTVAHVLDDDRLQEFTERALQERLTLASSDDHERRIEETRKQISRYEDAVRRLKREIALSESETERRISQEEAVRFGQEADHLCLRLAELTAEQEQIQEMTRRRGSLADRAGDLLEVLRTAPTDDRKEVIAAVVHHVLIDPQLTEATIAIRAL